MGGKSAAADNKGPDNNKRLAMLETGVSSLSVALAANGLVKEGEAYDVFAVTVAAIKRAAEADGKLMALIGATTGVVGRFAPDMELAPKDEAESLIDVQIRLLEQLAGHETPCDRRIHELEAELAARPTAAAEGDGGELEALKARVVELTNEVGELETDLGDMTNEKNRLTNELAAANEGRPIVREARPRPRKRRRRRQSASGPRRLATSAQAKASLRPRSSPSCSLASVLTSASSRSCSRMASMRSFRCSRSRLRVAISSWPRANGWFIRRFTRSSRQPRPARICTARACCSTASRSLTALSPSRYGSRPAPNDGSSARSLSKFVTRRRRKGNPSAPNLNTRGGRLWIKRLQQR
jgi:hypothetical protein